MQGAGGQAAELRFTGVRRLSFDYGSEVIPAVARRSDPHVWEVRLLSCVVAAETCLVSVRGTSGLGEGPFLVRGAPDAER